MHAERVGELIGKQDLIGIPFAGGLSELPFMNARQLLVNDKNAHLFNLYHILGSHHVLFQARLEQQIYHPKSIEAAKQGILSTNDFERAVSYFLINWMSRCSGGTDAELSGSLAMRWTASGGSSIARWNAAVEGLPKWAEIIRSKCECTCLDWREFAKKWKNRKGHALYLDPPWIDAGDDYVHKFTMLDHIEMAAWAEEQTECRVVIRHSDHPEYRKLYRDGWTFIPVDAVNQAGNKTGEVLIVNSVD